MSRSATPILAVDLFCGAGGTSSGILKACDERLRVPIQLTAVNHWQTAINTHTLNHPRVKHICEPVENIHPLDLIKGGKLDLLAASCECRFHSNARGGGPCNEQSRSQPWQLIRWATDIRVENILMENVREFMKWGPLNSRTKRPIKSRKGEYFRSFVNALGNIYKYVDWKVQVCADYGDATTRPRLILIARNTPIVWPAPTHGEGRANPWRNARECIDSLLKGKSMFGDDGNPRHCANTVKRIIAGFEKQGGAAEPFLAILRGTTDAHLRSSIRSLDEPLPTLCASGNHVCLVEPFVIGQQSGATARGVDQPLPTVCCAGAIRLVEPFIYIANHGEDLKRRGTVGRRVKSLDEPLPTVTTSGGLALCEPMIVQTDQTGGNGCYVRSIDRPLATVVTKQNMILVEPMVMKYYKTGRCKSLNQPLDTVTTKARFMLVEPISGDTVGIDILTRMLQPHELAASHSFPKHYKFTGTKADQTKQIGNSVPVELACAHAEAALR